MATVYNARNREVMVNGKAVKVTDDSVHALFTLGEGIQRDTYKAFNLYKALPEDTRKAYHKACETVFSRMTVNMWTRAIADTQVEAFYLVSPSVAQAYASIDDSNPQKPAFVALAKQALEVKGGATKFVADVKAENARFRTIQEGNKPAEEQVEALLAEKKALLDKLAVISAKIAELQGK